MVRSSSRVLVFLVYIVPLPRPIFLFAEKKVGKKLFWILCYKRIEHVGSLGLLVCGRADSFVDSFASLARGLERDNSRSLLLSLSSLHEPTARQAPTHPFTSHVVRLVVCHRSSFIIIAIECFRCPAPGFTLPRLVIFNFKLSLRFLVFILYFCFSFVG